MELPSNLDVIQALPIELQNRITHAARLRERIKTQQQEVEAYEASIQNDLSQYQIALIVTNK